MEREIYDKLKDEIIEMSHCIIKYVSYKEYDHVEVYRKELNKLVDEIIKLKFKK